MKIVNMGDLKELLVSLRVQTKKGILNGTYLMNEIEVLAYCSDWFKTELDGIENEEEWLD